MHPASPRCSSVANPRFAPSSRLALGERNLDPAGLGATRNFQHGLQPPPPQTESVTALQAALLGMVQGLTEFLPISSSAHLLLVRAVFGWEPEDRLALAFDVACHVGTLGAVLIYFRRDVVDLVRVAAEPRSWFDGASVPAALLRAIAIGTIPVVIVGVAAADAISGSLRTASVAGAALAIGAVAMLAAERAGRRTRSETTLGPWEALGLGVAQALALVPGVSRSGAVLTVAMFFGLRRDRAARFAFLLGIPAIVASTAKTTLDLSIAGVSTDALALFAVGIASSAVVGYAAVKYFIRYVSRYSLDVFAVYRLAIAAAVVLWAGG